MLACAVSSTGASGHTLASRLLHQWPLYFIHLIEELLEKIIFTLNLLLTRHSAIKLNTLELLDVVLGLLRGEDLLK